MKANETPEKIYVSNYSSGLTYNWHNERLAVNDIEYTRTDSFIKKACEFLDGVIYDYIELKHTNVDTFIDVDNKRFIDDFKKYMEEI